MKGKKVKVIKLPDREIVIKKHAEPKPWGKNVRLKGGRDAIRNGVSSMQR